MRPDGKLSHCSIGAGLDKRPEFAAVVNASREHLFDLTKGTDGLLAWAQKYPFDLCQHCTMWRGTRVPWQARPALNRQAAQPKPVPALEAIAR